jgi:hypothetical protein
VNIIPVPRRGHTSPLTDRPPAPGGLWRGGPETAGVLAVLLAGGEPTDFELERAGVARVVSGVRHGC